MRRLRTLRGQPIVALDGAIGSVVDVYFDDRLWRVRYLVLDTGEPMPQRQVLIEPSHVLTGHSGLLHVDLDRGQIKRSIELDDDKPVYLQHDMAALVPRGDPHLRSAEVVSGCTILASDGAAGHVKDLVANADWAIAALVVDTGIWVPGKRVQLPPSEVESIDWLERRVHVRLSRSGVRTAPSAQAAGAAPARRVA